jgi:hypothetical protein
VLGSLVVEEVEEPTQAVLRGLELEAERAAQLEVVVQ